MKLVYATDRHGDARAYELLAQFAREQHADVLILGGDWFAYSPYAAQQRAFVDGPFSSFLEHLHEAGIAVLAIPGNVDRPAAIKHVEELEYRGHIRIPTLQPYRFTSSGKQDDALMFSDIRSLYPHLFALRTTSGVIVFQIDIPAPCQSSFHRLKRMGQSKYSGLRKLDSKITGSQIDSSP